MLKLPGPHDGLKIGLFGGSFNPAHDGHYHVAETVLNRLQLDWVWWLVARGNPLKSDHGDFEARFSSAAAYTRRHPRMRVSDIERQGRLTFSAEVIQAIKARAATARFVWIMGGDNLQIFHKWKNWQTIASEASIAVVARPGSQRSAMASKFAQFHSASRISPKFARKLASTSPPAWTYLPAPLNHLSSSDIRQA